MPQNCKHIWLPNSVFLFVMRQGVLNLVGLGAAMILSYATFAQNYYEETPRAFDGELILGTNFSQVDGDTYYGYHKVAINTGAGVYVHFTQNFGATMELLYSRKGSVGEEVIESPSIGTYVAKYFIKLNYVEIPVTLHAMFKGVDFEAGASYSRLIKSKESIEIDQPVFIDPILNRFNNVDIDYVIGAAKKIHKHWYLNARFQYSIVSIRPPERIPYGYGWGNTGQFNNLLNLRLIYRI